MVIYIKFHLPMQSGLRGYLQIPSASSIFTTVSNSVSTAYFTTSLFFCFQIIYNELISYYFSGMSVQKHPEEMYTQFIPKCNGNIVVL